MEYLGAHGYWTDQLTTVFSAIPTVFSSATFAIAAAQAHCAATACPGMRHFTAVFYRETQDKHWIRFFRWNEPIESEFVPIPVDIATRSSIYAVHTMRQYGIGSVSGLVYGDIDPVLAQDLYERLNQHYAPHEDIQELVLHNPADWRACPCSTCQSLRAEMGYRNAVC